jgi:predicted alpha/beta hydrolase family esterase
MTKTAFIIHGIYGTPESNWQPWLKTKLESIGFTVFVPQFPTPEGHNLQNWLRVFEEYRKHINTETIMIGHSMAPAFILSTLETLDCPVEASFFVAPFVGPLSLDLDGLNKTFTEKEFNWDKINVNCKKFYVYSSDNDEYVPIEKGEFLTKKLNAVYKMVPNAGHFNKDAGYIEFQQLFDDIKKVLRIDTK